MVVSVQFKNKNKIFCGKTYDYRILPDENEEIKEGDIIRMMDNNFNWVSFGTRTKVIKIKKDNEVKNLMTLQPIRFIKTSMEGD